MKTELINQFFHNNRSGLAVVEGYEKYNETGVSALYLINYEIDKEDMTETTQVWNDKTSKVSYFYEVEPADVDNCRVVVSKIRDLLHDFNKETITLEFNWV